MINNIQGNNAQSNRHFTSKFLTSVLNTNRLSSLSTGATRKSLTIITLKEDSEDILADLLNEIKSIKDTLHSEKADLEKANNALTDLKAENNVLALKNSRMQSKIDFLIQCYTCRPSINGTKNVMLIIVT